jgi:transposase
MVNYREILRMRSLEYSQRQIAASVHSSRNTISEVYDLADKHGLSWPLPTEMTDSELKKLFYQGGTVKSGRKIPDYSYIHKELAKPGVTLTLLWSEYCEQCRSEQLIPYQYTQFCDNYRKFANKTKATMRIKRKPGELLEVDWAGNTLEVIDEITGEIIPAYVFVATLPCSLLGYAEVFPTMSTENWINAHIHLYRFIGGVTRIIVCDNLKTGVVKHTRRELILNRSYQEMAEHYGTAIIPARTYAPKDKPSVEGTVGVISTWIIAALRNEKFFSFSELNDAIKVKLNEFNSKPFQKKKGSRQSAFEEEEKSFLMPLPASQYEMAIWSQATIQYDYLITVDNCKYSVPFEFIRHTVDIRYTTKTIEVFFHNNRIASHVRKYGLQEPQVLPEHMPENHKRYLAWNKDTFIEWAQTVGQSTLIIIKTFLSSHKVEQQGYKTCSALMKLADRYSVERIEDACKRALSYTSSPSLQNIKVILKTGQDKVKPEKETDKPQSSGRYGFTRGAGYFGGDKK